MDAQICLLSLGCQSAYFPGSFITILLPVCLMNGAKGVILRVLLGFSFDLLIPPQDIVAKNL